LSRASTLSQAEVVRLAVIRTDVLVQILETVCALQPMQSARTVTNSSCTSKYIYNRIERWHELMMQGWAWMGIAVYLVLRYW
jgi:hypothetical protein